MKIKCIYASTDRSSDAFYLSGITVPDGFLSLLIGRRKIAVVSQLEYARVKAHSKFSEVYEINALRKEVGNKMNLEPSRIGVPEIISYFQKSVRAESVLIPYDFPSGLSHCLQSLKLPIECSDEPFLEERAVKNKSEIAHIRAANKAIVCGFDVAKSALAHAKIKNKKLYLDGTLLTSERLRDAIDLAVFERGFIAQSTIVACGNQACDPHQVGAGPLKANELIIIDIFPRCKKSGYYGDMTRTFLKGVASDEQKALVSAVKNAQNEAFSKIKQRVKGSTVHASVVASFEKQGYHTGQDLKKDFFYGFIHSTGHGLGLDIHESPSLSPKGTYLKAGHVITVEPGLYYPNVGACRIEDVVLVTQTGYQKLSKYPYEWLIR